MNSTQQQGPRSSFLLEVGPAMLPECHGCQTSVLFVGLIWPEGLWTKPVLFLRRKTLTGSATLVAPLVPLLDDLDQI